MNIPQPSPKNNMKTYTHAYTRARTHTHTHTQKSSFKGILWFYFTFRLKMFSVFFDALWNFGESHWVLNEKQRSKFVEREGKKREEIFINKWKQNTSLLQKQSFVSPDKKDWCPTPPEDNIAKTRNQPTLNSCITSESCAFGVAAAAVALHKMLQWMDNQWSPCMDQLVFFVCGTINCILLHVWLLIIKHKQF